MSSLNLLFAAAVSVAPTAIDHTYTQCVGRTSRSNPAWAACGETYLKQLDQALNAAWKRAYASLEGPSRTQLLREQRAWLKFKDNSCQAYANGYFGREGQVLHFYGCRGAIVDARISELKSLYDLAHEGGELTR